MVSTFRVSASYSASLFPGLSVVPKQESNHVNHSSIVCKTGLDYTF